LLQACKQLTEGGGQRLGSSSLGEGEGEGEGEGCGPEHFCGSEP